MESPTAQDPPGVDEACPACRMLDAADGAVDGHVHRFMQVHTKNESAVFKAISRAQGRAADAITRFAGSMRFVYIHSAWFGIWILVNIGLFGLALRFDSYPFGLLTLIVSLEAIFLATFVMLSQNRLAQRAEARSDVDFENNLRAEIWAVHIGAKLGIDPDHVERVVQDSLRAYRGDETSG